MSARGVRRAPVVSESGDLVGVVSFDDRLPVVSERLTALAKLIGDPGAAWRRRVTAARVSRSEFPLPRERHRGAPRLR